VSVRLLALDTTGEFGSIALLDERGVAEEVALHSPEGFAHILFGQIGELLARHGLSLSDIDVFASASGPGSFTGVRVGLTAVKAWSEVYQKRIAAVSRLEALAAEAFGGTAWVAAFFNAQRDQVFGAIYQRSGTALMRLGDEMVIAPGKFVEATAELAKDEEISWVSMDAECVVSDEAWKAREKRGEKVQRVSSLRAPMIGRLGMAALAEGRGTDALALDANYVRRSDAEIFLKGNAAHGR